jgi:hypothetical protein
MKKSHSDGKGRHAREGGYPGPKAFGMKRMDSRLHGNDGKKHPNHFFSSLLMYFEYIHNPV